MQSMVEEEWLLVALAIKRKRQLLKEYRKNAYLNSAAATSHATRVTNLKECNFHAWRKLNNLAEH